MVSQGLRVHFQPSSVSGVVVLLSSYSKGSVWCGNHGLEEFSGLIPNVVWIFCLCQTILLVRGFMMFPSVGVCFATLRGLEFDVPAVRVHAIVA